jgi:dTDP-4-dehydrorhamnose 3,5-epimerase-like enzyme
MGNFNFNETSIDGIYIIEPKVFGDDSVKWAMKKIEIKET